ncbi:MerC domain-containing protein [Formosa sediminum]|uniref:MerC domain-containing protein n=1 Tax=Formosa sediminum TaxID=2594004 RepID=A0A516GTS9_9FLAO|nr:MerC domain-containing protein [Formosa sediminum]QDO94895.1 MerC domain-containing protein [Formosa sediminum]
MIILKQKPDELGALVSTLCLIHCVATPFIFIVQSCAITACNETPIWWGVIDYFFLIISFFAIYRSAQTTTSTWIKPAFWCSWCVLFFVIINEKTTWFLIPENTIYIPALALIGLHLYNRKYCQCNTDKCCTHEK